MTTCTPDACTEQDVPMFARSHSPSRCPARPLEPCATCGVVSEPNVRAVRLLTGDQKYVSHHPDPYSDLMDSDEPDDAPGLRAMARKYRATFNKGDGGRESNPLTEEL